jgi:hypothetical protein
MRFPIYIPSKSRSDTRLTMRTLDEMQVDYYVIVERQQYDEYASVIARDKLLILPTSYQDEYDTCDSLGSTKSKGPGPARNFAWDHSMQNSYAWHWVMDDNIRHFFRLNNNRKIPTSNASIFTAMEDFCLRYKNIAMAGPNYRFFATQRTKLPPFVVNTRIYSCNLIRNDTHFRWRGRYNEDTDLSLRMLKSGWCTVQFYAFLQGKIATQLVKGGNTQEFYAHEGTFEKSKMLVKMHPDVARLVKRFNRWHHYVDYRLFRNRKLLLRDDMIVARGTNEYDMRLIAPHDASTT